MALNFTGETLIPARGGNPLGRKLEGVRLSKLKKGQNQITFGEDVLAELGVTVPTSATVVKGTGKMEGKVLVRFGEGPFELRYTSPKRKTTAHLMSSILPVEVIGKAAYKVFADEKAIVIALPKPEAAANPAPAPAADPAPAPAPEAAPAADDGLGDIS